MKAGFVECEDKREREPLNNNVSVFVLSYASLHSGEQSLLGSGVNIVSSVSSAGKAFVISAERSD